MSKAKISDQATALAGLLQATNLVEQLAKTGNVKESELKIVQSRRRILVSID